MATSDTLWQHQQEIIAAVDEHRNCHRADEFVQAHIALAQELPVTQMDAYDQPSAAMQWNGHEHAEDGYIAPVHCHILQVLCCGETRRSCQPIHSQAATVRNAVFEENPPNSDVLQQ